jgi:hypothetical protein
MNLGGEILYDENDDNDKRGSDGEMPALRASVGEADAGSPEGVPELQTDAMGSAKPVGPGFIYILKTTDGRLVKIGYTTNLERRVMQLKSQVSVMLLTDLEVLTTFPGTRRDETLLHRRFSEFRQRGDWYNAGCLDALMKMDLPPSVESLRVPTVVQLTPAKLAQTPAKLPQCREARKQSVIMRHEKNPAAVALANLRTASMTPAQRSESARTAGLVGGRARAMKLTPEQRSEICQKAGKRRWDELTPEQRSEICQKAGKRRWDKKEGSR